ncbi:dicarboxylic amino acid permease [Monosporozyma unispora]|nr:amino acid transporter [Kazachstania unispora]
MTEPVNIDSRNKEIKCREKDDKGETNNISFIDLEGNNLNCLENNVTSNSLDEELNNDEYSNVSTSDGKHEGIRLKKNLESRHISMIAIGGSLGTGLLIGTGRALKVAGPAATLIAYSAVGVVVFFTMSCLGEMATYIPLDGFTSYASRYCDPALGFAVGYAYMIKYFILPPNQLTAAALVIQFWVDADKINPGVWITIVLVVITLINLFNVRLFGELEFWLSLLKIFVMIGLIILLFAIMLGANSKHNKLGFRYWTHPGAFKSYSDDMTPSLGKFVAFVAVLIFGVFAYLGIELTGIVAAEASNPRKSIPKAIKLTLYRIIVFYMITIFLVGLCVPYDDPKLLDTNKENNSIAASPFLIAVINSGIRVLPHIFNGCILIFVFSAANSDLYVSSRNLYSLAIDHKAPKFLAKTNRFGIPYYALLISVSFCLLAFMSVSSGSAKVFNYFVNVVSIVGILTWISILITYICFDKAVRAQGIDKSTFAYVSPFQPYGAYFSLAFCIIVALIKNFTVFIGGFDYESFITGYIGLPVFVVCYFGYKIVCHTKIHSSKDVDLISLKTTVDKEEMDHNITNALNNASKPVPKGFINILYNKIGMFLDRIL